jgi:hypothetical protein
VAEGPTYAGQADKPQGAGPASDHIIINPYQSTPGDVVLYTKAKHINHESAPPRGLVLPYCQGLMQAPSFTLSHAPRCPERQAWHASHLRAWYAYEPSSMPKLQ